MVVGPAAPGRRFHAGIGPPSWRSHGQACRDGRRRGVPHRRDSRSRLARWNEHGRELAGNGSRALPGESPHNIVHILFGVWGRLAARTFTGAKLYAQVGGVIYLV